MTEIACNRLNCKNNDSGFCSLKDPEIIDLFYHGEHPAKDCLTFENETNE